MKNLSLKFDFLIFQITILVRRGITEYVDVIFFVMENNVVIAAQRTVDTLNQMTLKALTQRFADTVNIFDILLPTLYYISFSLFYAGYHTL